MSQEVSEEVEAEVSFKDSHRTIKKGFDDLFKLFEVVYNSPNGKVEAVDGTMITKKDLTKYKAAWSRDYGKLLNIHNKSTKKSTKSKSIYKGKNNKNPMFAPMFVNDLIVNYFSELDLGPAFKRIINEEENEESETQLEFESCNKELKKCLNLFLKDKITSCASLTPLFILATRRLKLQDPNNKQFVIPDERFKKFFGPIFEEVVKEQITRLKDMKDKIGKTTNSDEKSELQGQITKLEKNPLDPNKFRLVRFQTIVSHCRQKDLTEEQKLLLKDKNTIAKIEEEQKIISDTLKYNKSIEQAE